jgi:hypothetical protein
MRAIIVFMLFLACVCAQAENKDEAYSYTILPDVNTTFECHSTTGSCYYLITQSLCDEKILSTGQKQKACHITRFLDFKLASNEKKLVSNLASDFQYCMKPDRMPDVTTCIASPIPH